MNRGGVVTTNENREGVVTTNENREGVVTTNLTIAKVSSRRI
jgi:hypothetical protein